jgi:hypothetical protein
MSEDNQQEKKPQESIEEFCKRLGIRMNKRKGGAALRSVPWWEPFAQEAEAEFQRSLTDKPTSGRATFSVLGKCWISTFVEIRRLLTTLSFQPPALSAQSLRLNVKRST